MKKLVLVLATAVLFSALPAFAMEHGNGHDPADVNCAKECEMMLRDCSRETNTIQQKIAKLRAAIKKNGADQAKLEEVKALKAKLAEAEATLKGLEKPGK